MMRILPGISTYFGIFGAVAAYVLGMLQPLQDALEPLGLSPNVFIISGTVLATAVIVGRMGQEITAIIKTGMTDGEAANKTDSQ